MPVPVVDIFAGPGGLGEGFSSFERESGEGERPFRIALSAEMEGNAVQTLRLRSFFRQFPAGEAPDSYYDYIAGRKDTPWTERTRAEWDRATGEALQLTLGESEDNERLRDCIRPIARKGDPWVLVGGPPCQAYSLVGRSRNRGIKAYRAEQDQRHFLYRQYLDILSEFRPPVFVMENVKGILSSRVGGEHMFPRILEDLAQPAGRRGPRYSVVPVAVPETRVSGDVASKSFIMRAEALGVPQARHRVVLLGLVGDISPDVRDQIEPSGKPYTVRQVVGGLPKIRSGVTDRDVGDWHSFARDVLLQAARASYFRTVAAKLDRLAGRVGRRDPGMGGRCVRRTVGCDRVPAHLKDWLLDSRLHGLPNHEARSHMTSDLVRYAYAAAFASTNGRSPRGAEEFPDSLRPAHRNWSSGKFVDRFKVQVWNKPGSTVTSHLRKDGHYFIHPDPAQFRSFSVREAARLQTFPDNYFFEGARGAQFQQVGNAVPPWMARQIAGVVYSCLQS